MLRPVATRPLLLVMAALALAGCDDDEPSDEEQIRSTLSEFQRATADRDYGALCDRILAPKLIETVEQIGLDCEDALTKAFEDVRDPRLSVGAITVDGDGATAQVRSSAAGQAPSEDTLELVRTDDGWRIASLGDDAAP
jgi:Putative lumazine-binding